MAKKEKKSAISGENNSADAIAQANPMESVSGSILPEATPTPPPPEDGTSNEALKQELSEVRELARSLFSAVQEVRSQSTRNEILRSAIQDVKSDVRAAQQAALMTPAVAGAAPYTDPHGGREGKCGPCECVSDGCCCFDIKIASVRAAKPQIEPADMGDIPGLINALEVQMFFSVNGRGILLPAWPHLRPALRRGARRSRSSCQGRSGGGSDLLPARHHGLGGRGRRGARA